MASTVRILFSIGSLGGGGAERQVVGILRRIDRASFTPLLHLLYRQGELLGDVPSDVPLSAFADRYESPRWNYPGRLFLKQGRDFARVLEEQRVDMVYARTSSMALVAHQGVRRCPVPWVAVEAIDPRPGFDDYHERFRRIKRWLVRRAYSHANRVLAVSEGVRQGILEVYGIAPEKVTTVRNFLDLERIDRLSAESVPLEPGRFHIICAGRLHRQKGYLFLLQAVEELVRRRGKKEILLHILGQGSDEMALKSFVASSGLGNHVQFVGFTPNPYAYFRNAQLFCLSSLYEGMPNALLEAMACRVPVLSTDCPSGPREILDGGRYGRLIPMGNAGAIADAITDAIGSYDRWRALVLAARMRIETEYSPAVGIARLQQVLMSVHSG